MYHFNLQKIITFNLICFKKTTILFNSYVEFMYSVCYDLQVYPLTSDFYFLFFKM